MNVINIRSVRTLVVGMKSGFESNSYQDLPNHLDRSNDLSQKWHVPRLSTLEVVF